MKKNIKFISVLIAAVFIFNIIGLRYAEAKDLYQFLYEYTVDRNNILESMEELQNSRDYFKNSAKYYIESIKHAKIGQRFIISAREETDKAKKKEYYEKAIESVSSSIKHIDIAAENYETIIKVWTSEDIFARYDQKSIEIYQEIQNWFNELIDSDEIPDELRGYLRDDVQSRISTLQRPGGFKTFQESNLSNIRNTKKSLEEINKEIKEEMETGVRDPWNKWEKIVIYTTIGLSATACVLSILFFQPAISVSCVYLPAYFTLVFSVAHAFGDSSEGIQGIVIASGALNVRESPRRIAKRIKQLQPNEKVTVIYITKDEKWYGIRLNGEIGWVFGEYISLEIPK